MAIVREDVQFLNPGQIPVVDFDQPLYAIAKQVQWNWPDQFGEDQFVMMLGLHTEMAASKLTMTGLMAVVGQTLWYKLWYGNSFLNASHITTGRGSENLLRISGLLWYPAWRKWAIYL